MYWDSKLVSNFVVLVSVSSGLSGPSWYPLLDALSSNSNRIFFQRLETLWTMLTALPAQWANSTLPAHLTAWWQCNGSENWCTPPAWRGESSNMCRVHSALFNKRLLWRRIPLSIKRANIYLPSPEEKEKQNIFLEEYLPSNSILMSICIGVTHRMSRRVRVIRNFLIESLANRWLRNDSSLPKSWMIQIESGEFRFRLRSSSWNFEEENFLSIHFNETFWMKKVSGRRFLDESFLMKASRWKFDENCTGKVSSSHLHGNVSYSDWQWRLVKFEIWSLNSVWWLNSSCFQNFMKFSN